jgi:DNA replication licensing factor MCM3
MIKPKEIKDNAEKFIVNLRLGFTGHFGFHHIKPHELLCHFLSSMIRIDGVVTKSSSVTPKLKVSVHLCPTTKKVQNYRFFDNFSLSKEFDGFTCPTKDDEGNFLETEYGMCTYEDFQLLTIQNTTRNASFGQIPRSVDVVLERDLVDMIKPGDEVSIVGVYRQIEKRTTGQIPILCKAVLVANNIEVRTHRQDSILTTLSEIQEIRRFVFATSGTRNNSMDKLKRFKMLNLLALSLAPSIYGLDVVKRSLILQLVGGVRKSLSSGTHLRGDINILLVGEPGVAKSQLLRAILHVSPLSISTTGRSSSEAGLTAVVTRDKETKERRVEAGAMVLADRGILLVDEFDKMTNQDRMSIHEALEQQTVTITKAGVHITLNARCSVLAAANPLFGMYDTSISLSRNINLPDSLMSRFDLMFVLVDKTFEKLDEKIARHVLAIRAESESISEVFGFCVPKNIHVLSK